MEVVQHVCLEKKHFPKTWLVQQKQAFPQEHGYVSLRKLHFPKEQPKTQGVGQHICPRKKEFFRKHKHFLLNMIVFLKERQFPKEQTQGIS